MIAGLIPARAGNTRERHEVLRATGAHPRSRGEHVRSGISESSSPGSSPLARGTPKSHGVLVGFQGLIPARAGNTVSVGAVNTLSRAHPRSRGEHGAYGAVNLLLLGSSPLARGTRDEVTESGHPFGLIPARAGNTHSDTSFLLLSWAHPRSRGEHLPSGIHQLV